jgi:hypothetical protein
VRRRLIANALGSMTRPGITILAGLTTVVVAGAVLMPASSGPCRRYAQRRTVAEAQM